MRIVHHRNGEKRTLAETVERADSPLSQARGVMFRRSMPADYALVFPFDEPDSRTIHTLFVFVPLDVLWVVDDEVVKVERLEPFRGLAHGLADTVIELPAGAAEGVTPGDTIEIRE
ncbi:DUF192 domain-containing protein [Halolamina litorea]|uniref:DUF192 domain-containing protein n=1 Tax=Halolamina litorea TaxID=1515593 RepID=A0ABD6BSI7_9EURY|nr:DUF192 domain-containing protein [Halolamina litorea]